LDISHDYLYKLRLIQYHAGDIRLKSLSDLEWEDRKKIFVFWPLIVILLCTIVYYKSQTTCPLDSDQLTNMTIVEYFQNPDSYAHDPLWGNRDLFLPLNLGVFVFYTLSRVAPIEEAIPAALTCIVFLYLIISFAVFHKLSQSSSLAICLSLLSCLPVGMTSFTEWGVGYSPSFLSRTIFVPFVPPIFYAFLNLLNAPTVRKGMLFYFSLGLLAFVHQISSFYLFLSFLMCSFLLRPRLLKVHLASLVSWVAAISPLLIYTVSHYSFASDIVVAPSFLQKWIEFRFFWAFYPTVTRAALESSMRHPFYILILLIVIFGFRKNPHVKHLTITTVAVITGGVTIYGIQFFFYNVFGIPFKFVDIFRGLRFLPFIAFLSVGVVWQDLETYFRRVHRLRSAVLVALPLLCVLVFTLQYYSRAPESSADTCSDPIFAAVHELPPNALIATDNIENLRYCGKRSVYVIFRDGATAYYNGTDQFLLWVRRIVLNANFFKAPNKELAQQLKQDGVTHLFIEGELPPSPLWEKVHCSSRYCVYKLE